MYIDTQKDNKVAKTTFKKNKVRGLKLFDFKTYYKATISQVF